MTTAISTILVFGLLIFIHELGHFSVAKLVGVRVYEFSIGFGQKIASVRRGDTLYALRLFPLGGFVNMAGMDDELDMRETRKLLEEQYKKKGISYTEEELEEKAEAEVEKERLFSKKPVWARMAVIVAGPVMNFVLAAVIFTILFMSQGISEATTTIDKAIKGDPAAQAGLRSGDKIVSINGEKVETWEEITQIIGKSYKEPQKITVLRDSKEQSFTVVPRKSPTENRYIIGIYPKVHTIRPGPVKAVGYGIKNTYMLTVQIIDFVKKMITKEVPVEIGGPVRITMEIGKAAKTGFYQLLLVAALFSNQLAIFNLLPIPALDGSRLMFLAWEGVRGRPVDPARENFIHLVGFALLLLMVAVITYRDIMQIFFG